MTWTQPCCEACWIDRNWPRAPVRIVDVEQERCCFCGRATLSGIYLRIDPSTVPFPRQEPA